MAVREEQLASWARPLSETEDNRCENAVSQIQSALRSRFGNDVYFIRQGSHRNRTNIRLDSDVDVAVVHGSHFWPELSALTPEDKALHEKYRILGTYPFPDFKRDVHDALVKEFGGSVERKNKCIRISGTTTRVHADVVPAFEHKRFRAFDDVEHTGIEFMTDNGGHRIYSFPDQHYDSGVAKNDATSRAYKSVVRILKHVRNEMTDKGIIQKDSIPSFFLESLVWNVPHSTFSRPTWKEVVTAVTLDVWSDMRSPERANEYAEVSDLKWLFRGRTTRTPKQAEDFMLQAWLFVDK